MFGHHLPSAAGHDSAGSAVADMILLQSAVNGTHPQKQGPVQLK
jgi:hypothetical protein